MKRTWNLCKDWQPREWRIGDRDFNVGQLDEFDVQRDRLMQAQEQQEKTRHRREDTVALNSPEPRGAHDEEKGAKAVTTFEEWKRYKSEEFLRQVLELPHGLDVPRKIQILRLIAEYGRLELVDAQVRSDRDKAERRKGQYSELLLLVERATTFAVLASLVEQETSQQRRKALRRE